MYASFSNNFRAKIFPHIRHIVKNTWVENVRIKLMFSLELSWCEHAFQDKIEIVEEFLGNFD